MSADRKPSIAVVIPSYRVAGRILGVLGGIGPEVTWIYVVDDACPEQSGAIVESECRDPRVRVLRHSINEGVGAATMTGYRAALADGADVVVKLDGDGQMPPDRIAALVEPLLRGEADYVKGNRFYDPRALAQMPRARLVGNAALSFMSKLSSGYWNLFDPTNGFTAIHSRVIGALPLEKVSRRYFFESDLLFHLNIVRAVVREIPMEARYGDERSGVRLSSAVVEFGLKHAANVARRVFYNYFLRDFSIASLQLVLGSALSVFGFWVGVVQWSRSIASGEPATSGTVMLAALPIVLGFQLLLAFVAYDIQNVPRQPVHRDVLPARSPNG
jgi:dolichol-phosphate mannosyltransferase